MTICNKCGGCTCNGSCTCESDRQRKVLIEHNPEDYEGLSKREAIDLFLKKNNKDYITAKEIKLLGY